MPNPFSIPPPQLGPSGPQPFSGEPRIPLVAWKHVEAGELVVLRADAAPPGGAGGVEERKGRSGWQIPCGTRALLNRNALTLIVHPSCRLILGSPRCVVLPCHSQQPSVCWISPAIRVSSSSAASSLSWGASGDT